MARSKARLAESEPVEGPWTLPPGWGWRRLGDAVEVHDYLRRPLNQSERNARLQGNPDGELYPYYGATGQVGEIDGYLAEGEYVLLGEDGAPFLDKDKNKAYLVSGRFWVNNHAHVLRAADLFGNKWLVHWLNTTDYRGVVNGTTRLKLTQGAMNEMPVPIPPAGLEERIIGRIDELFTEVDDGEAALERARGDLATWRKSLLKAAVTGELTADWRAANPPTETGADLLARILSERRARWLAAPRNKGKRYVEPRGPDVDGLPGLPGSWTWASVEQLATDGPTNGYSPAKSTDGTGTLALKLTATTSGKLRLDAKSIKSLAETIDFSSPLYLEEGDVLFQRGNTRDYVGMAAVYDGPPKTYIYPDLMIRVRTGSRKLTNWLWRWSVSPHGRRYLMDAAQGGAGTMPKISGQTIRAMPVPLPPDAEQDRALQLLDANFPDDTGLTITGEERSAAATLRQSVLAAAFRGDLVA